MHPSSNQIHFLVGLVAAFVFVFYLVSPYTSPSSITTSMASCSSIAGLDVTLSQSSTSPPTIVASVTNKNDHAVAVLTYGSPLDSLAVQLGLVSVTPAGASEPLNIPTIKASRLWPPTLQQLVTIQPGASSSGNIVLKAPQVNLGDLGGKATVQLKGKWEGVWSMAKEDISKDSLGKTTSNPECEQGEYTSPKLEIAIE